MNYLIATIKSWNIERARDLISKSPQFGLITDKKDLTLDLLKNMNPRYIFFPHWSWLIPKEIYEKYECVIFHATDLPFGRGGSPIQNLIDRGIYKTKITALKAVEELDAGPVYFKINMTLYGSGIEIFNRISRIVFYMIKYIIKHEPEPTPQEGEVTTFVRRKPEQSDISSLTDNTKIYDYIRMLDAEGYPPAFVETKRLRIDFSNAKLEDGYVIAQAKLKVRERDMLTQKTYSESQAAMRNR